MKKYKSQERIFFGHFLERKKDIRYLWIIQNYFPSDQYYSYPYSKVLESWTIPISICTEVCFANLFLFLFAEKITIRWSLLQTLPPLTPSLCTVGGLVKTDIFVLANPPICPVGQNYSHFWTCAIKSLFYDFSASSLPVWAWPILPRSADELYRFFSCLMHKFK